jgi:hypothetical protein
LPLIGPDFPLSTFAQRGPLLAWTPHLAGVAFKLDPSPPVAIAPRPVRQSRLPWIGAVGTGLVFTGLLVANLWYMIRVHQLVSAAPNVEPPQRVEAPSTSPPHPAKDASRERFARALYEVLVEKGAQRELQQEKAVQLERYDGLVRRHPDLQLDAKNEPGKLAVAATAVLAGRGAASIEESVRKALSGKGFSDRLINAACEHVSEQFVAEAGSR